MGDTVGLQVGVSKNQSYIDSLLMFEIALVYSVSYPYVPWCKVPSISNA